MSNKEKAFHILLYVLIVILVGLFVLFGILGHHILAAACLILGILVMLANELVRPRSQT